MLALALISTTVSAVTHGWDCVSCKTNSMLAGNFASYSSDFNMSDPWWIDTIADSYAIVMLNNFGSNIAPIYTGVGDDSKIIAARALKKRNPKLQVWFYQPADRLGDTPFVQTALNEHPGTSREDHCAHLSSCSTIAHPSLYYASSSPYPLVIRRVVAPRRQRQRYSFRRPNVEIEANRQFRRRRARLLC